MNKSNILLAITAVIVLAGLLITGWWSVAALIVASAIAYSLKLVCRYGRLWWSKRSGKVARRERFLLFIVSLMLLFLATGTALHLWAFYTEGDDDCSYTFTTAEYLLRSMLCSLQLFTGNIDSNVLDGIKEHYLIKGLISVQAVLSFACTMAVLITMVFARMKAYVRFHRQTHVDNGHNHLYVFFGMNEPSRLLAKSIRAKEGDRALIVYVENPRMDEDDKNGWNNIVGMFTHRRQTFTQADEVDARVTFTETRLCDMELEGTALANVLGEINLQKLREIIQHLSTTAEAKLHFFFLSENEDENIRAVSVLASDATIHQVKTDLKLRFYCHARRNGLNRVVEDIAVKRKLEVHIVDSSHLAVELLKSDGNNHPARLVDTDPDNPTTVKSEFNALIVGFDEAGQDALRFLYEFGAFVDVNATPEHEMRSPFHCIVTDKRMDELRGTFATLAPAAMARWNPDGTSLIELRQCDCRSSEFYTQVLNSGFSEKLNYVVIAVGDDELGMTLAIRILNHIRKQRADLTRLRIYVRSYRSDREAYMKRIADFYNEAWFKDYKKSLPKGSDVEGGTIIIPFGQKEKIYTYEMIVNEELTEKGKLFSEEYARIRGEKASWVDRRKKVLEDASLNSLRSLRRKEMQDKANALHADTKMELLLRSLPADVNWDDFFRRYFGPGDKPICDGCYDKIHYTLLNDLENKAILNLARLEHIRWNASHEMLGYTKAHKGLHHPDERLLQHNCLRPWQELDQESLEVTKEEGWDCDYKKYDFGVADITLLLYRDRNKQ